MIAHAAAVFPNGHHRLIGDTKILSTVELLAQPGGGGWLILWGGLVVLIVVVRLGGWLGGRSRGSCRRQRRRGGDRDRGRATVNGYQLAKNPAQAVIGQRDLPPTGIVITPGERRGLARLQLAQDRISRARPGTYIDGCG